MTDISITAHNDVGFRSPLSAIRDHFAALRAGMQDGSEIERRHRALSRKTSSELAALGLERCDIARAALDGHIFKASGR